MQRKKWAYSLHSTFAKPSFEAGCCSLNSWGFGGGCRLDAPFGTAEKPVEVPSMFDHRVVGVPDPDDDSLVWWGIIEEGSPPKQIIEDGEYFVLKRVEGGGHH